MVVLRILSWLALLLISGCWTVYPVYQPPTSGPTATVTARSIGEATPVRVHDDNTCSKATAKLVGYLNNATGFGPTTGSEVTFKIPAGRMLGISVITTMIHPGSQSWSWCPGLIDFWPDADKHYLVEVSNDYIQNRCSYDVFRLDSTDANASRTKVRSILRPGCRLDNDRFE